MGAGASRGELVSFDRFHVALLPTSPPTNAIHCIEVYCSVVWCGVVWCIVVERSGCSGLWCGVV